MVGCWEKKEERKKERKKEKKNDYGIRKKH